MSGYPLFMWSPQPLSYWALECGLGRVYRLLLLAPSLLCFMICFLFWTLGVGANAYVSDTVAWVSIASLLFLQPFFTVLIQYAVLALGLTVSGRSLISYTITGTMSCCLSNIKWYLLAAMTAFFSSSFLLLYGWPAYPTWSLPFLLLDRTSSTSLRKHTRGSRPSGRWWIILSFRRWRTMDSFPL